MRNPEFVGLSPIPEWFLKKAPRWVQWAFVLLLSSLWAWERLLRERTENEPKQAIIETLIFLAITIVLNELLRPKPNIEQARPAGLGDFPFPTATEDRPVPLLFGTALIEGPNVVWYGDFTKDPISKKVKTGMWKKDTQILGYRYRVGVQFGLCRGPNVELLGIDIGEKPVFSGKLDADGDRTDIDDEELFGGNESGQGGLQATCDFYTGSDTQLANAYLDDDDRQRVTVATTPAAPRYVGASHLVTRELTSAAPLASNRGAYVGNTAQVQPWAFECRRLSPLFGTQTGGEQLVGTFDSNMANVAYELITNAEWGFGYPDASIDLVNFKATADTLRAEGNGFSMLITSQIKATEIKRELERQADGFIFIDQSTGKWVFNLARDDYDINTVPEVNDDNIKSIVGFTRGSWEDTTNQITVAFTKREDRYKTSTAVAMDMANAMIQGGGTPGTANIVEGESRYPGCMDADNAARLAWRDVRGQSYPLARGVFTVTREFWDTLLNDVVALTSTQLGFTKLPMRVVGVDLGDLQSNEVALTLVQDVFKFRAAGFGSPQPTLWSPPVTVLAQYPTDEQVAFESPRAVLVRDPEFAGDDQIAKVWCGARRQTAEITFQVGQRNAPGSPTGLFNVDSVVVGFLLIGELKNDLDSGVANPTATITLASTPDGQSDIVNSLYQPATPQDLGVDLANLILVGTPGPTSEFMAARAAVNGAGSDVDFQNVYRGMLDSGQLPHSAGDPVYLMYVAGAQTETIFPNTNNVEVEFRAQSASETFAGSTNVIALTMNKRTLRPYSPGASLYNGTSTPFGTPDVEGDGSGLNGLGFDVDWWRRRFDTSDEVAELLQDNPVIASTEYRVRIFVDPDGANTEITGSPFSWMTGTGPQFVNRLRLWDEAPAGTKIRVEIEVRHDLAGEVDLTGQSSLNHDVIPTSVRDGDFYLGGNIPPNTPSNLYTAVTAGTFVVNIGAAYSTSNVQYRINGGSWVTVIAAGGTTGNIAGVVATDTIELQHTVSETPDPQYVELVDPLAAVVAYGTFSA